MAPKKAKAKPPAARRKAGLALGRPVVPAKAVPAKGRGAVAAALAGLGRGAPPPWLAALLPPAAAAKAAPRPRAKAVARPRAPAVVHGGPGAALALAVGGPQMLPPGVRGIPHHPGWGWPAPWQPPMGRPPPGPFGHPAGQFMPSPAPWAAASGSGGPGPVPGQCWVYTPSLTPTSAMRLSAAWHKVCHLA